MDRYCPTLPAMPLRNVGTVILLAMAAAKPNVIQ